MKTTWDELMRYAPEQEYSLPPLEDSETERLLKRTMAKLNTTGKARKPQKFVRKFLLAAALAALLCVSVFAAYSLGWFDQLFGSSAALVKESVASYDAAAEVDITYPTYTEAEQAMLADGTMQVPDQAQIAETGVSAQTDDFVFTLESMLVSKDTLYAIMRQNVPRCRTPVWKKKRAAGCCLSWQATIPAKDANANGKTAVWAWTSSR